MSRICRNMEDSGKHRFHRLEHDSKMRLFKNHSHTSTLRGYEASENCYLVNQKTTNGGRKTGDGLQKAPANGGIDRGESHHFPQNDEGGMGPKGTEKGKQEVAREEKKRKRWGRRWDSRKPRQQNPERPQKSIRTQRTKPNSRAEWTSYFTLRGRSASCRRRHV